MPQKVKYVPDPEEDPIVVAIKISSVRMPLCDSKVEIMRRKNAMSDFILAPRKRIRKPKRGDVKRDVDNDDDGDGNDHDDCDATDEKKRKTRAQFKKEFEERVTKGEFSNKDLKRIGVRDSQYKYIPIHADFVKFITKWGDLEDHIACRSMALVKGKCGIYHHVTDAEAVEYGKAVLGSDGFDLPFQPTSVYNRKGMLRPLHLAFHDVEAMMLAKCAKLALLHYNNKHGTDYHLETLVKANIRTGYTFLYHLTFYANPSADRIIRERTAFQARILESVTSDITIAFCEITSEVYLYIVFKLKEL